MKGNFVIYLLGYILVVIGVAYALHAAGLASQWIIAAVLVLGGLGIVYALSRSQRDASAGTTTTTNAGGTTTTTTAAPRDDV